MDPDACFIRFIDAGQEGDTMEAFHAINELSVWYQKGGFPATFPGGDTPVPATFVHNMVIMLSHAVDAVAAFREAHDL